MFTNFESFLTNFSFLTLFLGMLLYWIEISNFTNVRKIPGKAERNVQNSSLSTNLPVLSSSLVLERNSVKTISGEQKSSYTLFLILLANVSIFILLGNRWKESGHFPLSNLYESLMFLSWTLTTIHLFLEFYLFKTIPFRTNETLLNRKNIFLTKFLGAVTTPSALFTNAFATFSLPKEMQAASPLVPALQSNWLMMHVTVMILSYGALLCGSLLAIAFLVLTGGKDFQEKEFEKISNEVLPKNLSNQTNALRNSNVQNLEKLAMTFDNLSYRILGIGFPLLTIGILSGAVWANEAWGSYWSWDPKETWALLTWFVFAIYLHTRLNKGWQGKKPALIASLGFIFVWVCYLGVNLLGEGLHSYGWFNN